MDIRSFFWEYKTEIKNIKPFWKKVFNKSVEVLKKNICIITFTIIVILFLCNEKKIIDIVFWISIILTIEFLIFLFIKKDKIDEFLKTNYNECSLEKKKKLIKLLKDKKIEITEKDSLKELKEELEKEKKYADPLELIFYLKETSIFLFIIVPIIKFFNPKIKKVYDNFMGLVNDTSTLFGILVIIVIFLIPFIILYISYIFTLSRYNSLIYDLNQIIVFNNYYKDKCENL